MFSDLVLSVFVLDFIGIGGRVGGGYLLLVCCLCVVVDYLLEVLCVLVFDVCWCVDLFGLFVFSCV